MTNDNTAPDQRARLLQELLEILEDPQVKGFALRYAGDREVADDALQTTYYVLARLRHLEHIKDLRAYFYQVLRRETSRERRQLRAVLADDFASLAEERQGTAGSLGSPPSSFEDAVSASLYFRSLHNRLAGDRDGLLASVPARSADPNRYRAVIRAVADQVLRDGIRGEAGEADTNDAFRAAYPEYFNQPGVSPNTCHQRLVRARSDVRNLVLEVVQAEADFLDAADAESSAYSHGRTATLQVTPERDEQVRTADDAILSDLFLAAEQVRLPREAPYDLERELKLFTEWLGRQE